MTKEEIALQILLKMMENHLFPNTNPDLIARDHVNAEKMAESYNKILSTLKTD